MKIYITLLALCITYNCAAMELTNEVIRRNIVTRHAEITNETGKLVFELKHDTETNTYSGTVTNEHYSMSEHKRRLTPEKAEKRFHELDPQ